MSEASFADTGQRFWFTLVVRVPLSLVQCLSLLRALGTSWKSVLNYDLKQGKVPLEREVVNSPDCGCAQLKVREASGKRRLGFESQRVWKQKLHSRGSK